MVGTKWSAAQSRRRNASSEQPALEEPPTEEPAPEILDASLAVEDEWEERDLDEDAKLEEDYASAEKTHLMILRWFWHRTSIRCFQFFCLRASCDIRIWAMCMLHKSLQGLLVWLVWLLLWHRV